MSTNALLFSDAIHRLWPFAVIDQFQTSGNQTSGSGAFQHYYGRLKSAEYNVSTGIRNLVSDHKLVFSILKSSDYLEKLNHDALLLDKNTQKNKLSSDSLTALEALDAFSYSVSAIMRPSDPLAFVDVNISSSVQSDLIKLHSLDRILTISSIIPLICTNCPYIIKKHFKSIVSSLFSHIIKPKAQSIDTISIVSPDSDVSKSYDTTICLVSLCNLIITAKSIPEYNNKDLITSYLFPITEKISSIIKNTIAPQSELNIPVLKHSDLVILIDTLKTLCVSFGLTLRPKQGLLISLCKIIFTNIDNIKDKGDGNSLDTSYDFISYNSSELQLSLLKSTTNLFVRVNEIPLSSDNKSNTSGVLTKNVPSLMIKNTARIIEKCNAFLSGSDKNDEPNDENKDTIDINSEVEEKTEKIVNKVDNNSDEFYIGTNIYGINSNSIGRNLEYSLITLSAALNTSRQRIDIGSLLKLAKESYNLLSLPIFIESVISNNSRLVSLDEDVRKIKVLVTKLLISINHILEDILNKSSANGTRYPVISYINDFEFLCTKSLTFNSAIKLANFEYKVSCYKLLITSINVFGSYFVNRCWKRIVPQILDDIDLSMSEESNTKDSLENINTKERMGKINSIHNKSTKNNKKQADMIFSQEEMEFISKKRYIISAITVKVLSSILVNTTIASNGSQTNNTLSSSISKEALLKNVQLIEDRIVGVTFDTLREIELIESMRHTKQVHPSNDQFKNTIGLFITCLESLYLFIQSPLSRREAGLPIYVSLFSNLSFNPVKEIREICKKAMVLIDSYVHPILPRIISSHQETPIISKESGVSFESTNGNKNITPTAVSLSSVETQRRLLSTASRYNSLNTINDQESKNIEIKSQIKVKPLVVYPEGTLKAESIPFTDDVLKAKRTLKHVQEVDEISSKKFKIESVEKDSMEIETKSSSSQPIPIKCVETLEESISESLKNTETESLKEVSAILEIKEKIIDLKSVETKITTEANIIPENYEDDAEDFPEIQFDDDDDDDEDDQ